MPASRVLLATAVAVVLGIGTADAETLHHVYHFDPGAVQLPHDGSLVSVRVGDLPVTWEEGQPELPYDVVMLLVPRGSHLVALRARASSEVPMALGVTLRPATAMNNDAGRSLAPKPPRLTSAALQAASLPSLAAVDFNASLYPAILAEPAGGGALHGYQMVAVRVYPVRYDAARQQLLAARSIDLDLELDRDGGLPLDRERYSSMIEYRARETLLRLVANPQALDGYERRIGQRVNPATTSSKASGSHGGGFHPSDAPSLEGSPVEYVIVTSEALAPAWQALANWKTQRGVPTVVRTTEWIQAHYRHGSDLQETVRTFIRDAYLKWGVEYVLLGGDTDVIPARYGFSSFGDVSEQNIPTDMYFACLDGNWNRDGDAIFGEAAINISNPGDSTDLYAEVFVGRAPVSTVAETNALTAKITLYENPTVTNYQQQLLLLGEVLFPVDWSQNQPISLDGGSFSQEMLSYVHSCVDSIKLYDNYTSFLGAQPLSRASAVAAMNAGPGFVNHIGHGYRYSMSAGDFSLTNTDALGLTNVDRRFVLYMLNCTATAFDFPCLAEAFLKSPGGAVAVLGSSRSAYALPARNYNREFFKALHVNGFHHLGEAFVQSRLAYTPNASFDTSDHYSHFLYNYLGDPEIVVHTCSLATTAVACSETLGLGPATVAVHVTTDGTAREGALVCLSKGTNGAEAYVYGTTDVNGDVSLLFQPESPGTADLTVSGANMRMGLRQIAVVAQPGAYLHAGALTLDDDAVDGSNGNADGVLDAGETLEIDLAGVNDGPEDASGVTGVLRVTSPWVTVVDSSFTLGSVAHSGGSAASTHETSFAVSANTPDGTVLPLELRMTDGVSSWTDVVRRVVHAPSVEVVRLQIDDTLPGGNGNGQIDAGETFDLLAWFKNYGTGADDAMVATLASMDPDITILTGSVDVGDAAPQQELTGATHFRITEASLAENPLDLTLVDGWGRTTNWTITLRGPAKPAKPTLSTKAGGGLVTATWTPSVETDLAGYQVYRALAATGPWTRISTDRTLRTAYYQDTGLVASTKYYYRITALDVSGNESVPSDVNNINTNPAYLTGWPIQLGASSSCPVAVGDITGDGSKEIVAGNDHLYAWNWNGLELRDDDNDPITWGIFANEVKIVTGAVALAEMDGNPGLEAFVTCWDDSNKAFVVRGDGAILPGWPRNPDPTSSTKGYWASSAAVDVDADGLAELFAPAKNGNLYAWHADGTALGASAAFKTGLGINQRTSPAFANLDADPELEIIYGAQNGQLFIWNKDGSNFPNFPVSPGAACLSNVAVGDVNHDGIQDVVMLTEGGGGFVNVYNTATGTQLPGWPRTLTIKGNPISPSPALADFDGDGLLEIVIANDGGSSAPQLSAVRILDSLGNTLPGWPKAVGPYNSESSPIVADISGDGVPDILFGNEGGFLYGWDRFGDDLPGFPITIGDFVRSTPFVDDIDGDGRANLVLAGWDKNVYIWDFQAIWNPAAAQWPTLKHDVHRSGTYGFVFDIAPPQPPTALTSPSHVSSTWSNDPTIDVTWSGAADASGIGGYSYVWDTVPGTLPDVTLDTVGSAATSPVCSDGQSYWFHLRTVDTHGNWTASALHLGPFWIDATPPVNSASAQADRPIATWSTDPTIDVTWTAAADSLAGGVASGLAGYSLVWDQSPTTVPDTAIETTFLGDTSPAQTDGNSIWFHLRAVDAAGNGVAPASTLHLGPFWIDTAAPSIAVLAPNGGEVWANQSVETIRWHVSDAAAGVSSVQIRYSTDGGTTYAKLIANPSPGDSTYDWTVPLDLTNQARVEVLVSDAAGHTSDDASDSNFALTTATDATSSPPVVRTALEHPAPNPFNPTTTLRYSLFESGHVRLAIYDARGRLVRSLVDAEQLGNRWYAPLWDGRDGAGRSMPSGAYFARLSTPSGGWSQRLVLAK